MDILLWIWMWKRAYHLSYLPKRINARNGPHQHPGTNNIIGKITTPNLRNNESGWESRVPSTLATTDDRRRSKVNSKLCDLKIVPAKACAAISLLECIHCAKTKREVKPQFKSKACKRSSVRLDSTGVIAWCRHINKKCVTWVVAFLKYNRKPRSFPKHVCYCTKQSSETII